MQNFFKSAAVFAAALTGAFAAPQGEKAFSAGKKLGEVVPDSYIVVLKENLPETSIKSHKAWAQSKHHRRLARRDDTSLTGITNEYGLKKLKGYAGKFDKSTIDEIRNSPEVAYIEEDTYVYANALTTQTGAPWGISRVSQKATSPSLSTYYYDSQAGSGVNVYVIDTGILTTHNEFEGRASLGANFATGSNVDGNGHGTHVAGTIAGKTYGVAKKANVIAVRVLGADGSGTNSGVISGIQWAASDASSKGKSNKSVANMSLGGGKSTALNSAVASAVSTGLTFVVAAGNDNANAANYSPASEPSAITVGSTTSGNARSSFSNYGSVVDIFAPGSSILSTWIGSNTATNTISGTSMASPHVAGIAAYLIGVEGLSGSTAVTARIKALGLTNRLTSVGTGSPNLLAYSGAN
ncbi:hypothetical protein EX30DRAFT_375359 [Ascodesmis nigricans]|uniref:Subtilisin-like protein n=1 Tax=Ascodesmis nigricans TaxID=341454 RepID=A0A4S2MN41_9PEZI|nr:hypothetical protein EX30DRAFT_375359 [Ascodesmis nigricans]